MAGPGIAPVRTADFRTLIPLFGLLPLGFLLGFEAGVPSRTHQSPVPGTASDFEAPPGFRVEEVYPPEKSGSVVALTFDSRGRLVFSRERGPVVTLLEPGGARGGAEQIFTEAVTNCQGLHFDGKDLLAVGHGPEGAGLYRVIDRQGDGRGDRVETVMLSSGPMAEHGPHTVFFGPDGHLYWVIGNHAGLATPAARHSPHRGYIEGHLLPRYTDPRGHAARILAPGGIIARRDLTARRAPWELVAGGFRNQYDAAFNILGELFTFDSDMEWDINLPWFRPVRTNHVVPGGEYGWRTGSSKWPEYYLDSLPAMTDVGRGSPTGVAIYQHHAYPQSYYEAFFQGDWSRGRILVGFLERSGATYRERSEEFVTGVPLNVTGLAVGPDGWLYFAKGGRMTEGGIYRVVYEGPDAEGRAPAAGPLDEALTQPQPRSAWSREHLAAIRNRLERRTWERGLTAVVEDPAAPAEHRVRALELLQVYGPPPRDRLLVSLGDDPSWEVRAASTYYLGLRKSAAARRELARRLADLDPFVRRRACEALVRSGIDRGVRPPFSPVDHLLPLLGDPDRFVRFAARLLLERTDPALWKEAALTLNTYPAAPEALLALAQTGLPGPDLPRLLERQLELVKAHPDPEDLPALLRVIHLTFIRAPEARRRPAASAMGEILLARFPTGQNPDGSIGWPDPDLDRELALTLAYLETPGAVQKLVGELSRPRLSREQQIHYAYCLRVIREGWRAADKEAFIAWFEKTQDEGWKGGASFLGFIENIWNDFLAHLPPEEKEAALGRVPSLNPHVEEGQDPVPAFRRTAYAQSVSEAELEEYLVWDPMSHQGDPEKGRLAYEKAFCSNCHIFGDLGREAGPDLTDVGRRFRRQDLVEAILYPSRTVSDLWAAEEIVTEDGASVIGVVSAEDAETLTLLTAAGFRLTLNKADVRSRTRSEVSMMPDGLLHNLERQEMIDLLLFLERGP